MKRPAAADSTAERAAALRSLLDAEAGFDPETVEGLTNHRPMALQALARLGASAPRMKAWAAAYERRLQPVAALEMWSAGDAWYSRFGDRQAGPAYRDLFTQWLEQEAAGDVLQQVLPRLLQGLAGAAFHGAIRTAHAVAAAHRAELADALAYWASRWLPLGASVPDARPLTDDPETLLRRLAPVRVASNLITPGLQAAAAVPGFDALASQLRVDQATVPRLAGLAAKAYAASGSFSVLHLVTGALAVQELLQFVDPDDDAALSAARAAFWRAFMATVAAAGMVVRPAVAVRSWAELNQVAIEHDDEHAIKLVDACRQWFESGQPGPWAAAASRALVP